MILHLFILLFALSRAADNCDQLTAKICSTDSNQTIRDPSGSSKGASSRGWDDLVNLHGSTIPIDQAISDEVKKGLSKVSIDSLKQYILLQSSGCKGEDCRPLAEDRMASFLKYILSQGEFKNPDLDVNIKNYGTMNKLKQFGEILEAVPLRLNAPFKNSSMETKVRDGLFEQSRGLVLETLNEILPAGLDREALASQVKATHFSEVNKCTDHVNEVNADYNPKTREVRICEGMLNMGDSVFRLVNTLGHEIAHAIDPARAKSVFYKEGAPLLTINYDQTEKKLGYYDLVKCLRGENSLKAEPLYFMNRWRGSLFEYDQITEAFADFIGTEVLVKYIKKEYPTMSRSDFENTMINVLRYQNDCHASTKDQHSKHRDRIAKMSLAHPWIREKLGCTAPVEGRYCGPAKSAVTAEKAGGRK